MTAKLLLTATFLLLLATVLFWIVKAPIYMSVFLLAGALGCGAAYLNFKNK